MPSWQGVELVMTTCHKTNESQESFMFLLTGETFKNKNH